MTHSWENHTNELFATDRTQRPNKCLCVHAQRTTSWEMLLCEVRLKRADKGFNLRKHSWHADEREKCNMHHQTCFKCSHTTLTDLLCLDQINASWVLWRWLTVRSLTCEGFTLISSSANITALTDVHLQPASSLRCSSAPFPLGLLWSARWFWTHGGQQTVCSRGKQQQTTNRINKYAKVNTMRTYVKVVWYKKNFKN